jgi:tetratricopeptide (TPR) repeat protein
MSLAAKHRKQAAEYEKQQDFERALTAYTAAIQESDQAREEVDVALFNKVGDLALRLGRIPEAMTHYERAVDQYAASGRFNNAIALCNKIKRTTPNRTGIYLTLGRICARKGLRGDASSNFLDYATRMQQDGRTDDARRALMEVAALFPDIPELQRLVAELQAVVQRQRRRINQLERQLQQSGIDVSTTEDVPVYLDRDTPQNGLPSV